MKGANAVFALDARYALGVYRRFRLALARGKGAYVWDVAGRKFIDCVAGVAVNNVGHCHPEVVKAVREQAGKLMQPSNWFYNEREAELHEALAKITPRGLEKSFLSNSGTEAVEAAVKLARKATGKRQIIAMKGGFHGRTLGALALTWKKKYRKPFEPLLPRVRRIPFNDAEAVRKAVGSDTAAVIVEPVQGEGGVRVPKEGYLKELRELCDEKGVLLIADEIQTGFGRTGKMFACEWEGVVPDVLCMAKGLGGGFPIGAVSAVEDVARAFGCGDHGSTFGGNPLACSAALASIRVIKREKLAEKAFRTGKVLVRALDGANAVEVRGKGLLVGIEIAGSEWDACEALAGERVLASCPTEKVIRLTPPLVISEKQVNEVAGAVKRVLGEKE